MTGGYPSSWIRPSTRLAIYLRDGFACVYCGQGPEEGLTLDHVEPRSRGGSNESRNLVTACKRCNQVKRSLGGRVYKLALYLGRSSSWTGKRVKDQQGLPLTTHLRRRAINLMRTPPDWLLEIRRSSENFSTDRDYWKCPWCETLCDHCDVTSRLLA